jgi:SM-20-related protein
MNTLLDKLANRPPPHGILRDWLGAETVGRLLEFALANRARFRDSEVGYDSKGRVDTSRRRSQILFDLGDFTYEIRDKAVAALPALFDKLGSPPFKPSRIELELVAHGDGAFFSAHTDTFVKEPGVVSHRVISAVYYFNAFPKGFTGGALRLHPLNPNLQAGAFVDIEPDHDTLAFFPSWFLHEVMPVHCPSGRFEDSRFAINCWFHR